MPSRVRRTSASVAVAVCAALAPADGRAQGAGVVTIDYPSSPYSLTYPNGINASGEVVGSAQIGGAGFASFTYDNGVLTPFSAQAGSPSTTANGINAAGQISGFYDYAGGTHGFVETAGALARLDVPGASATYAFGLNNFGQVVGYYDTGNGQRGFVESAGAFTTFAVPGSISTNAFGINDAGEIVGSYVDAQYSTHGFVDVGGVFTTVDGPASPQGFSQGYTELRGINNLGQIVGYSRDDAHVSGRAFLYAGGAFTSLAVPGANGTNAFGINDAGQIVGQYFDGDRSASGEHGFVASAATLQAVPEPGTFALAAAGLGAVAGMVRRRRAGA